MIFGDVRCTDRETVVRTLFLIIGLEHYLLIKESGVRSNNNDTLLRPKINTPERSCGRLATNDTRLKHSMKLSLDNIPSRKEQDFPGLHSTGGGGVIAILL